MTLFCQNMLEISAELAWRIRPTIESDDKFIGHFLWIATFNDPTGEEHRNVGRRRRLLL